jgi:hypothetical protein
MNKGDLDVIKIISVRIDHANNVYDGRNTYDIEPRSGYVVKMVLSIFGMHRTYRVFYDEKTKKEWAYYNHIVSSLYNSLFNLIDATKIEVDAPLDDITEDYELIVAKVADAINKYREQYVGIDNTDILDL